MILELLCDMSDQVFGWPPEYRQQGTNAFADAWALLATTGPLEVPRIVMQLTDKIEALQQRVDSERRKAQCPSTTSLADS